MRCNTKKAVAGLLLRAFGLLVCGSYVAVAERLPVRLYTTADGLAQNAVNRIARDSRGFLWFCTDEGPQAGAQRIYHLHGSRRPGRVSGVLSV